MFPTPPRAAAPPLMAVPTSRADQTYQFNPDYNNKRQPYAHNANTKTTYRPETNRTRPMRKAIRSSAINDPRGYEYTLPAFHRLCPDGVCSLPDDEWRRRVSALPSQHINGRRALIKITQVITAYRHHFGCVKRVVDVGCAPGHVSHLYSALGYHSTGMTLDPALGGVPFDAHHVYNRTRMCDARLPLDLKDNYQLCVSDIGPYDASIDAVLNIIQSCQEANIRNCVIKTFLPRHDDNWPVFRAFSSAFEYVDMYKPPASNETNREVYLIGTCVRRRPVPSQDTFDYLRTLAYVYELKRMNMLNMICEGQLVNVHAHKPELRFDHFKLTATEAELQQVRMEYANLGLTPRLNVAAAEYSRKMPPPATLNLDICTGAPGCGKTTAYREITRGNPNYLIVSPMQALADNLNADHFRVRTRHTYLHYTARVDMLIIDEFYQFTPGEIHMIYHRFPRARVVVFGDPSQIPPICNNPHIRKLRDVTRVLFNNFTHRLATDATTVLNRFGYPGLKTTSTIGSSIAIAPVGPVQVARIQKILGWNSMCYNNDTMQHDAASTNSNTIHRSQGLTFRDAILHIDANAMASFFDSQHSHIRVALSRHTENLLIVGDYHAIYKAFHLNSVLETNAAMFDQHHTEVDIE